MNSRILYSILMLVTITLLVSGCVDQNSDEGIDEGQITVAVSILPQEEFIEKIGGDRVKTVVMIPPGASPATHEPTPGQLRDISKASTYFIVGSGLPFEEVWLDKITAANKDMLIVDTSEGISLRSMEAHSHENEGEEEEGHENEEDHLGMDPHIWLSPINAKVMIENTYKGLAQIDPDNEEYYRLNKESYLEELDSLDLEIRENLSGQDNRNFMVFHPSWGYFADEYNLNMIPVEIEGKEPSAQDLVLLIDEARGMNTRVIFVQPQFNTQSAKSIAREIDGEVVIADSLAKNYVENMRVVSENIARGLT